MCGIFAAIDPCGLEAESLPDHLRAINASAHRGPDNIGHFQDGFCFLGHSRLSIIDLAAGANQPFQIDDVVMSYNGEVFNFEELRDELRSRGRTFRTDSDTEVVLHAYLEWGVEAFTKLNGMWAIIIYDTRSGDLVICRDRFGQKPLFIGRRGSRAYFSSEAQQIAPLVDGGVDFALILRFCREGAYESDGRTFFRNIQEFPKAHYLRIRRDGRWESARYWSYPKGPVQQVDQTAFAKFDELFSDAVRLRLRSDVPFGILVSGGVDSTLIAHYSRVHCGPDVPIRAFTYSSQDGSDELVYASKVAERLHLNLAISHQELVPEEYTRRLRSLVQHLGRGHSSPAIVSVDYLYQSVASAGVRVALDGQGADELLAGYKTYFPLVIPWYLVRGRLRQAWLTLKDQRRFGFLHAMVLAARNTLPPALRKIMRTIYGYEKLFVDVPDRAESRWVSVEPENGRNCNLLNRYLIRQHAGSLENLLYYGDIVAMRSSVENRSPFMDHRVVEFAFGHDDTLKLHDAVDKYALRVSAPYSAYRDILERPKIGFASDINRETRVLMVSELQKSVILDWPIFSSGLRKSLASGTFLEGRFERLLFRLYQIHLWSEIFGPTLGAAKER